MTLAAQASGLSTPPVLRRPRWRAASHTHAAAGPESRLEYPLVVEPYALVNHRGNWYVLGKSRTHAQNRLFVFKVERILGARVLHEPFTVPKDFDVQHYTLIFTRGR